MITAWVAVDKNGSEYVYSEVPFRGSTSFGSNDNRYVELPKGSIKKLTGIELTWEDKPVKIEG